MKVELMCCQCKGDAAGYFCSDECVAAAEVRKALTVNPWENVSKMMEELRLESEAASTMYITATQPPRPNLGYRAPAQSPAGPDIVIIDYMDKVLR